MLARTHKAILAPSFGLRALPALGRRHAWGAPELSQIPGVPLNVPLYDEPPVAAPEGLIPTPETRVSTLSNGLRVVSQPDSSAVATMGVVVNTGSRFETEANSGVSYMLQLLAFTVRARARGPLRCLRLRHRPTASLTRMRAPHAPSRATTARAEHSGALALQNGAGR